MNQLEPNSVDVLINVFGKPYQTALSLLSLLRHCDRHIRRIYFQEEALTAEYEKRGHADILDYLGARVVHHIPRYWIGSDPLDEERARQDAEYRLSVRYQHGWENCTASRALIIHNDIYVHGDIIAALDAGLGEHTGIGQIGQCWWCPAGQTGRCAPDRYREFKPSYTYLMRLYNQDMDYTKRRAYNLGLRAEFHRQAWPLPECRLNEWVAYVNMDKARPDTQPLGAGALFGAFYASGAKIGVNWDRPVNLDTAVMWFHDLNNLGHTFRHYPIAELVRHDKTGRDNLEAPEKYIKAEYRALARLKEEFPEFAAGLQ